MSLGNIPQAIIPCRFLTRSTTSHFPDATRYFASRRNDTTSSRVAPPDSPPSPPFTPFCYQMIAPMGINVNTGQRWLVMSTLSNRRPGLDPRHLRPLLGNAWRRPASRGRRARGRSVGRGGGVAGVRALDSGGGGSYPALLAQDAQPAVDGRLGEPQPARNLLAG